MEAISQADLVLWVIDLSNPIVDDQLSQFLLKQDIGKLIVLNKNDCTVSTKLDIPKEWAQVERVSISALKDEEIVKLKNAIYSHISGKQNTLSEAAVLTNLRQKAAAERALNQVQHAESTLNSGMGYEFLANDLSDSLQALGDIVGETTPDELLNKIFSGFCIGK